MKGMFLGILNMRIKPICIMLVTIILTGIVTMGCTGNSIEESQEESKVEENFGEEYFKADEENCDDDEVQSDKKNDQSTVEKVIRRDLPIKQATITEWGEGEETNEGQTAMGRFMSVPWDMVKNNVKIPYADEDWTKNIILINEIPEQNIAVYGYNDEEHLGMGVAIDHNGNVNYFDWPYMDNHTVLPSIFWDDANKQLQVVLHTGYGAGYSMPSLHILQEYETMHLEDYCFELEDVQTKLQERIGYTYDDEGLVLRVIDLKDNTELCVVDFEAVQKYDDVSKESPIIEVRVGDIFSYELGESIQMTFTVGYIIKGQEHMVWSNYVPQFQTTVTMNGDGEFTIGDISVAQNGE